MELARRIMSSPPSRQENVRTENMSSLLDTLNMRRRFPGVLDLANKFQQWLTDYGKDIAGNDLLRMMKLAQTSGTGVDWSHLSMCLPNIACLSKEHVENLDGFLALCVRDIFMKAARHFCGF